MIKILKWGKKKIPDEQFYKMKCKVCGCEYIYQESDLKYDWDNSCYLVCPQCEYVNTFLFKKKYKNNERGWLSGYGTFTKIKTAWF